MRHLQFHHASRDDRLFLLLMESDGTKIMEYNSVGGSFATIERDGRKFRLNGKDRDTGELIYLPEIEPLP